MPQGQAVHAVFFPNAFGKRDTMARVLIVDHSPSETLKLSRLLQQQGHQVLSAENGADGVALAREEQPDAILMDIVMPGLNGFQATRQISKDLETRHIPVVIISNRDQDSDKSWGLRQGAKAYLVKPIASATLAETLDTLLIPNTRDFLAFSNPPLLSKVAP